MMNKRILSFLLAVILVIGLMPTSVFATENEGEPAPTPVIEPAGDGEDADGITPLTEEDEDIVPQNGEGEEGEDAEPCTVCNEPGCEKTHAQCEACGTWDCEKTHTQCEVCDAWDCTEHEPCALCGAYDCGGEHEYCTECDKYNCGIDHNAACDKCGVPGCTKAHIWCDTCQKEDCGVSHVWCDTCQKNDCGIDHTVTEPSEETTDPSEETTVPEEEILCDKCEATKDEEGNVVHEEDCLSLCTCEPVPEEGEAHEEACPLYEEIEESEKKTVVDAVTIQVAGKIPEDVSLSAAVRKVEERATFKARRNSPTLLFAYDITLTDADGKEWQPEEDETVTVSLEVLTKGLADGNAITVVHEHGDDVIELGEYIVEDGKLTFETDGFSTFYFYITYEFGGYSYTMSGEGEVYLSDLLDALNIGYSVKDVSSVVFSNPEYIEITKKGSDWLLKSLRSFGTEETLTIAFDDGETYEIVVKDPVIFNYAVGSDITNVPLLATANRTIGDITNGDETAEGKTYKVNTTQISVENVQSAGVVEKTAGTHPAPDAIHMIVYATEGMAIDFIGGTDWTYEGSKPTNDGNDIWFWAWEGATDVRANYVVVKPGAAGKQSKFTVTTTVESKKYYCNVLLCVVENSKPTKLAGNLPDGYSIKNVPVTLYNYDGKAFNANYDSKGGNYFAFSGYSKGENADKPNAGWGSSGLQANGGGGVALMGIVQDKLVNGLPVMSQGQNVDLFSTNSLSGKTVYPNVDFQFVYNDSTGYYTYNGALNHAQYNRDNNTIELYKQSLAPSDTANYATLNGSSHGNAGFYPFEDINKAYTNTAYSPIDSETWKTKLEKNAFELIPAQYTSDIALTNDANSTVDLHYGLQVKSDFYLPKGKQLNGTDMIYEFTGDDDLWVFIDGELVLDIGGGHTYVSGSFNLTTGEVWVEKYTQLAAADGGSYSERVQGTDLRYTDSFLTGLKDDQMHTLQIFYLERHAGVSNCRMRFNLPLIPSNSVTVGKELLTHKGGDEFAITPETKYTFTVYTATDMTHGVIPDETKYNPLADATYEIVGGGTGKTGPDGKFTLEDGQFVTFTGIDLFTDVYVVEDTPVDKYSYSTPKVSINDGALTEYQYGKSTAKLDMELNKALKFAFTNYMNVADITITKDLIDNYNVATGAKYEVEVKLNGDAYTGTASLNGTAVISENGKYMLGDNESVVIRNIPVNTTYSIVETAPVAPSGYEYKPVTYGDGVNASGADVATAPENVKLTADAAVVITNELNALFGHLTITKTGIDALDNHPASADGKNKQEQQSTIYTIKGTSDSGTVVDMEVVLVGNDSITINYIPVGTYTVTEKVDWSWRYDNTNNTTSAEITGGNTTAVDFENDRERIYWLSGDNYKWNLFDKVSVATD